jgi:hypothetical protein
MEFLRGGKERLYVIHSGPKRLAELVKLVEQYFVTLEMGWCMQVLWRSSLYESVQEYKGNGIENVSLSMSVG